MQSFDANLIIGFSTGALALSDWRLGLEMSRTLGVEAVELSALRLAEFAPMAAEIKSLTLREFSYVSVHLPSAYSAADECSVLKTVDSIADKGWPLILHPDVIRDWSGWRNFGSLVCLENMDKRKPIGRTVEELSDAFERLPNASFCFDFGHARQVDPTMSQAARLLRAFGSKLQEIHFSDVDSSNRHRMLNYPALTAFGHIRNVCDLKVPVILETLVNEGGAEIQLQLAEEFFGSSNDLITA
jgi:hypothetical protein